MTDADIEDVSTAASAGVAEQPLGGNKREQRLAALSKNPILPAHAFWYIKAVFRNNDATVIQKTEKYAEVAAGGALNGKTFTWQDSNDTEAAAETFQYKESDKTEEDFCKLATLLTGILKEYTAFIDTAADNEVVDAAKEFGWIQSKEIRDVYAFLRKLSIDELNLKYGKQINQLITHHLGHEFVKRETENFCLEHGLNIDRTKHDIALKKKTIVTLSNPQRNKSGHALWAEGVETIKKLKSKIRKTCNLGEAKAAVRQRRPRGAIPGGSEAAEMSDESAQKRARQTPSSAPLIVKLPPQQPAEVISTTSSSATTATASLKDFASLIESKLSSLQKEHGWTQSYYESMKKSFLDEEGSSGMVVSPHGKSISCGEMSAQAAHC